MNVTSVKTKLVHPGDNLLTVISGAIEYLPEKSVLTVASKIFSFAENRLVEKNNDPSQKHDIIKKEAAAYLEPTASKYDLMFTLKGNWLFVNAGVDESNSQGCYTLWPEDPQQSLNHLWQQLRDHYQVNHLGLIMTDSRSLPRNWGVVGHGIAHCGFKALKSYIGKPDLFGRPLKMEQLNLMQSLAAAGTLCMGEGSEQTPIALIENPPWLEFQDRPPSHSELQALTIELENDVYAPFLTSVNWKPGGTK